MSYPNYPDNRMIVNGVDLTEEFKMVLMDGYTLKPPSPKTYTVEIPCGNGLLDLTESLLGDTAYENREQEFTFYAINTTEFEKVKTQVTNFLHGKAFDYEITMDPGYTYHGRFAVSEYNHSAYASGIVGAIKVSIDAKPFKYKKTQNCIINAIGGNMYHFESGRERVRPVIETDGYLKVIYNGKLTVLSKGAWTINDILFTCGSNEVYFNSYDIHNLKWSQLINKGITWGKFKQYRLFEWYKLNGDTDLVRYTWNDLSTTKWSELSNVDWNSLNYGVEIPDNIKDIVVKYEWGDL